MQNIYFKIKQMLKQEIQTKVPYIQ
jgi:hypothetical protein